MVVSCEAVTRISTDIAVAEPGVRLAFPCGKLAGKVGIEPTTDPLTAGCSASELLSNKRTD